MIKTKMCRMFLSTLFILSLTFSLSAGETKWIRIGDLHNWFHSAGCEIEVGRRHLIPDQQDGLQWPAQFRWQDCQAAKAIWIGATNYDDPIAGKTFAHKVVHFGPRVENELSEFMSQQFKLIGRFDHPLVLVDGVPSSNLFYDDIVDSIDTSIPCDRLLYNVVNTGIGITVTRKIYAFSNPNYDDFFIFEYEFENTGIYNQAGDKHNLTLEGVQFFFQYRYAMTKEACSYGYNWLPQSTTWGHNTMNEVLYTHPDDGRPFRAQFSWHGTHSGWLGPGDNIGGPNYLLDGRLGASQYVGVITLHADTSPLDDSDDTGQPSTTKEVGSDDPWTYNNDAFNAAKMTEEYGVMTAGWPDKSHATRVLESGGNADEYGGTPGGWSQGQGFGPYTLQPGEKVRIVMAEGAGGISRKKIDEPNLSWYKNLVYNVGREWLDGGGPFEMPDGSNTNDANEFKNAWVKTGYDSILKTFESAEEAFDLLETGSHPAFTPTPPLAFQVISGGDRIALEWSEEATTDPGFAGYRVYRTVNVPDTSYTMIYECGGSSGNPVTHKYDDKSAVRGFEYYYYVTAFDDGSNSPDGKVLESSKFWTMTNEPAQLKRPARNSLDNIRVVPNPYVISAKRHGWHFNEADKLKFYNLPAKCDISIYTERGDLVETIEHRDGSADEEWRSLTSSRQVVVSGLYIAYIEVTENIYDNDTGELLLKKGENTFVKFVVIR